MTGEWVWQYTNLPANSKHMDSFLSHGWEPFTVTHKDQLLVHLRRPAPVKSQLPALPEPAPVAEGRTPRWRRWLARFANYQTEDN